MTKPERLDILVRSATQSDVPSMARLYVATLGQGPCGQALVPATLKTKPGDENQTEWRMGLLEKALGIPGSYHMVAVHEDKVVGWTQFFDFKANLNARNQYLAFKRGQAGDEAPEAVPAAGLDLDALATIRAQETAIDEQIRDIMGREKADKALYGNHFLVDPEYQRKGVGQQLGKWIVKLAEVTQTECFCRGSPLGRLLYLTLGCEEVVHGEVRGTIQYGFVRRLGGVKVDVFDL